MSPSDTIAAISSAVGNAARMIVRMSGGGAHSILSRIAPNLPDAPVCHTYLRIRGLRISSWVYVFTAPRTVNGEDVVELHLPGNPLLSRWVLEELIQLGARHADPGEFTARAYFNGKIDLAQAEGVAAAVSAHSQAELDASRQLLAGELSRRLHPIMDNIIQTLALVEAGIDFVDEDIRFIQNEEARRRLDDVVAHLNQLRSDSIRFEPLNHWPTMVLVGRPNAGKSTLLNALAGNERAVVSPVAGTTRDVLSAEIALIRGSIRLLDVAGLESPPVSVSAPLNWIQQQMQHRAQREMETADRVILVKELSDRGDDPPLPRTPDLRVYTKRDLNPDVPPPCDGITVSAASKSGLDELRRVMDDLAFGHESGGKLALNARHLECIASAKSSLHRAGALVDEDAGHELLAHELRDALDALGRVLGEVTPDDVLGKIFSTFCIGK